MSISDRASHVLSAMLIIVFASSAAGWTSTDRTMQCKQQTHPCTTEASLSCCCPSASNPIDRIQPPPVAPLPSNVSAGSLVDDNLDLSGATRQWTDVTSVHWLRDIDLGLLHHTYLI